jgi:phage terminase large subunit
MWSQMRDWFEGEVSVPNDEELIADLATVKRKTTGNSSKLLMEGKDEMRRKGLRSPDVADALALTFALPFDLLPKKIRPG